MDLGRLHVMNQSRTDFQPEACLQQGGSRQLICCQAIAFGPRDSHRAAYDLIICSS